MDMNSGQTLFCFALKEELRDCRIPEGRRLVTGMGAVNAAHCLESALASLCPGPSAVFSCGFAGGLNPSIPAGTVLFSVENDARVSGRLLGAGARPGVFHCADRVVTTAGEKRRLYDVTGADAVDMESGAIRAVCGRQGIPFGIIRVISDVAAEDLPLDFNRLMTADRRLDYGRLALAVLRSPGTVPALVRLGRRTRTAARRLGRVLSVIGNDPPGEGA
jgi:nucleoside phosphorylase